MTSCVIYELPICVAAALLAILLFRQQGHTTLTITALSGVWVSGKTSPSYQVQNLLGKDAEV